MENYCFRLYTLIMNSLGINKPKKQTKVVVAMSGGVELICCCSLNERRGV